MSGKKEIQNPSLKTTTGSQKYSVNNPQNHCGGLDAQSHFLNWRPIEKKHDGFDYVDEPEIITALPGRRKSRGQSQFGTKLGVPLT